MRRNCALSRAAFALHRALACPFKFWMEAHVVEDFKQTKTPTELQATAGVQFVDDCQGLRRLGSSSPCGCTRKPAENKSLPADRGRPAVTSKDMTEAERRFRDMGGVAR